jgi:hypothetical protein
MHLMVLPETMKTLLYRPLLIAGEIPVKMAGMEQMHLIGVFCCKHFLPGSKVGDSEMSVHPVLPVVMPGRADKAAMCRSPLLRVRVSLETTRRLVLRVEPVVSGDKVDEVN